MTSVGEMVDRLIELLEGRLTGDWQIVYDKSLNILRVRIASGPQYLVRHLSVDIVRQARLPADYLAGETERILGEWSQRK